MTGSQRPLGGISSEEGVPYQEYRTVAFLVLACAILVAVISARDYAGSWNDGSRLATVESLVDYHTFAIDRSIFVRVPTLQNSAAPAPYPDTEPNLLRHGTLDKLFIEGHFYSDKSPVPALLMAIWYKALQWGTGLTAKEQPHRFCYFMTLGSAGLAYVVAIWCMFRLGQVLHLPLSLQVSLTASFGLATVALTYTRHVNSHILLLGVTSALLLSLVEMARGARTGHISLQCVFWLGTMAGLGYTIDLGAGPVILLGTTAIVVYRSWAFTPMAMFAFSALPWLTLHHALNYAIGGTFLPANMVPEYLQWPGSPFHQENMTGLLAHSSISHFLIYTVDLLVGKRGFLGHNLALFLAIGATVILLKRPTVERPEIICAMFWAIGVWLVYALLSNNYSGLAASIRWFVPLLVPGYFVLAVLLRDHPIYRRDFFVLSAWGVLVAGLMWWMGPWMKHMVPFFWVILALALTGWGWCEWDRRSKGHS